MSNDYDPKSNAGFYRSTEDETARAGELARRLADLRERHVAITTTPHVYGGPVTPTPVTLTDADIDRIAERTVALLERRAALRAEEAALKAAFDARVPK